MQQKQQKNTICLESLDVEMLFKSLVLNTNQS